MQKNKLAEIFLALFLLTLSVFVPNRGNENKSVDFIELPKKINGIPAVPIKLNKEEKDFINSGDVKITKKKYGDFIITLISSGKNPKTLHSPEICYEAWGYEIYNKDIVTINSSLQTGKITVIKNKKKNIIYYWFFNEKMKSPNFSQVILSSAGGSNNWHLVSIISSENEKSTIKIITYLEEFFTKSLKK